MAAAADGVFRSVFEGCLSGFDNGIERRPYHRNCGCALHNQSRKSTASRQPICGNVSYPMRRSWSEGSLVMAASAYTTSPSSSPAAAAAAASGAGRHYSVGFVDLGEKGEIR